ncbi:MAG TPA: hypothetical protein VFY04_00285 [Solirubrobacterales bacterium]|nr:hypothetical protein [Solirubrobacterales bacterium]
MPVRAACHGGREGSLRRSPSGYPSLGGALAEWLRSGLQSLGFFGEFLAYQSQKYGEIESMDKETDRAGSRMITHYFGRFWQ